MRYVFYFGSLSVILLSMGLEHFIEGAGEHAHMLGVSAPMKSNAEAQNLYTAEYGAWDNDKGEKVGTGWTDTDPEASKKLTIKGARDFAAKVINHPAMDSIPGIEDVRKNFDPKTDVVRTKKLWWTDENGRPQTTGGMVTSANDWEGKPNRLLINRHYSPDKKITVGGLTHEISHMLVNDQHFPAAGHNWAMARTHLHIVKNVLGDKSYQALKAHYDQNGVDYGGKDL